MIRSRNQKFSIIKVVIVLCMIAVIGALGYFAYRVAMSASGSSVSDANSTSECKRTDGVDFCVTPSAESVSPTDELVLKVSLINRASGPYSTEEMYSSSCNEPSVTINDEEVLDVGACTTDITSIEIEEGATKRYDVAVDTSRLVAGKNAIKLAWDGQKLKSNPVTVTLEEATALDEAKSKSCLGEQEAKAYCSSITIVFEDEIIGSGTTCESLEAYVEPLGVKAVQSYCNQSKYGILTVYVPKAEADAWVARLKNVPNVKSVFTDS